MVGDREAVCLVPSALDEVEGLRGTRQTHRLIRYANGTVQSDTVIEQLFFHYFVEGGTIDDTENLIRIAVEAGLEEAAVTTYLSSDEDFNEVRLEDSAARRLGIQGVPCFIINNQYALSGAQEPEAFFPIFEIASQEMTEATG